MVFADVAELDALNVNAHTPEAAPLGAIRLVICLDCELCWLPESHNARATANDPKLSDRGARRDGCAGEGGGAAGVTRGTVRCSAWLGVPGFIGIGAPK